MRVRSLTGFAGVAPNERPVARRWARVFEWPMIAIALWICFDWYQMTHGLGNLTVTLIGDWLVWGFFVLESAVLTYLVRNRARYLRENWGNALIIVLGFPPVWLLRPEYSGALRLLRILVLAGLLTRLSASVRTLLSRNHLGTTLFIGLVVVVLAGVLMAAIDPGIKDPMTGIWWAWTTFTTVGYGDIVPTSALGRVLASVVILLGVCLVAVLTANLSAYLAAQDGREVIDREIIILEKLEGIEARLSRIEQSLDERRSS